MIKGDNEMIKTVKGKVIAGAMAFGLVAGTGIAYGASDAGQNLKAWYDGQFGKVSGNVKSDSDTYLQEGLDGVAGELEGLKRDATGKIFDSKDSEVLGSTATINKQAKEYIDSIGSKKTEIEGYMDAQFEKLKAEADETIFKAGNDFSAKAHSELETLTKKSGTMAQKSVQVELGAVTNRALDDIEKAIIAAKTDLGAQLDKKASATTEEIKGMIDNRVGEVRYFITGAANYMVQEQEELIATRAQQMEDAAKKQMDDLVNGI